MIVCDICGKHKNTKSYLLPMVEPWVMTHEGKYIYSYNKYVDKPVDLCEICAQTIADAIDHLQRTYQKKED